MTGMEANLFQKGYIKKGELWGEGDWQLIYPDNFLPSLNFLMV
jgi:hypothetical protein